MGGVQGVSGVKLGKERINGGDLGVLELGFGSSGWAKKGFRWLL